MTAEMASRGLTLIALGLASKLLIADRLAPHVDRLFGEPGSLGVISGWAAGIGYSLQLYFDFAGYSTVAIGLALMLGFRFPQNFDSPFKAQNISDFWRRWHMTLSRWIRDYIFIPLGGSRGSRAQTTRNLTIAMLLGGLWHGAGWTFVVWGLYHGVLLAGHAVARERGFVPRSKVVARALTFAAVVVGFVIFRAPDMHVAGQMLGAMFGAHGLETIGAAHAIVGTSFAAMLVVLLVFVNVAPNTWELQRHFTPRPINAYAARLLVAVVTLRLAHPSPFLYFKF
jgi:alginate O-acetyltransferase complex protein AlgI